MQSITRRRLIENAGLSVIPAIATATLFRPRTALAQAVNVANAVPVKKLFPINEHLSAWVHKTNGPVLAQIRQGNGTAEGLKHAATAVRLYANHLEAIGIDNYSKKVAGVIDPNTTDYSPFFPVDALTAAMQGYDSTYTREELLSNFTITKEKTQAAKESIITNGISWHFHRMADVLKLASHLAPSTSADSLALSPIPAVYYMSTRRGHLESGVFTDADVQPHLQTVSFWSFCKTWACSFFFGGLFATAAAGILTALAGMTVLEACGYETAAAIITEIASEGTGTAGAVWMEAACAWGMANYSSGYILSTVSIQAIVGGATSTFLMTAFGFSCP